jgi:hypothetical protein
VRHAVEISLNLLCLDVLRYEAMLRLFRNWNWVVRNRFNTPPERDEKPTGILSA